MKGGRGAMNWFRVPHFYLELLSTTTPSNGRGEF